MNQKARAIVDRVSRVGLASTFPPHHPIQSPWQGRLKMLGTLVFPKGKYTTLKAASGHVLCEDVFETMVSKMRRGQEDQGTTLFVPESADASVDVQLVFSEAWWVGRKEDNPDEKRLPMPPELQVGVEVGLI